MEQVSETITALHRTGRHPGLVGRPAVPPLPEPLVGPGLVAVLEELAQHLLQVLTTEDQQAVEDLAPGWCGRCKDSFRGFGQVEGARIALDLSSRKWFGGRRRDRTADL